MKHYDKVCFLGTKKKVIPFEPEINVEEIKVTKEKYDKYFPIKDGLDYTNLRLSNIGEYSIATPVISQSIADTILADIGPTSTVTDAFGNMGGMTIALASRFSKVNVSEIVPIHCEILKNNLNQYGLLERVNIVCGDFMENMHKFSQIAVVLDPPWGGRSYKNEKYLELGINNVNIICIINKLLDTTKYIYMMVPYNYKYEDLQLIDPSCTIVLKKLEPQRGSKSKMLLRFNKPTSGGSRKTRRRRR